MVIADVANEPDGVHVVLAVCLTPELSEMTVLVPHIPGYVEGAP